MPKETILPVAEPLRLYTYCARFRTGITHGPVIGWAIAPDGTATALTMANGRFVNKDDAPWCVVTADGSVWDSGGSHCPSLREWERRERDLADEVAADTEEAAEKVAEMV
jgi:hypothetical protein